MCKFHLKDIAVSQTGPFGSQLHEHDYVEMGTPIVTVEHLGEISFSTQNLPFVSDADKQRLSKYILKEGDIVFSRVGSVDRCTYVSENEDGWLFSGRCLRVRVDRKKASPKFISYYFRQKNFKTMMLNISVGATMPSLNTSLMDNIPLILPNYIIQQKIAAVLSALDDKIELNNKINGELEAMAKTLYDYWFVQFDFPNKAGKPYKSSDGAMVWNEQLKREIPEGWEVRKLGDFIAHDKNGDWGKEIAEGNYIRKVKCIRGADINGINGKGEVNTPTRYILEKNESKILDPNDIVVEISGGSPTQSTGRLALITQEVIDRFENPLICSNFCKAVSLGREIDVEYFVYSWNRAYESKVFFGFEGKTSGIKNLLFDTLVSTYSIVLPTDDLLQKFQKTVGMFEKNKQQNLKQNQTLSALRDWLLPMLMNGQVSVGEAYEKVAEVLSVAAEGHTNYKNVSIK